ncbi:MAG: dipeptide ABC transporter ATP-binding protein, partial [Pseudomonadota bacterium]
AHTPTMTTGTKIAEPLDHDDGLRWASAPARSAEWLARVGIAGPLARLGSYPHELSGGMRQRVLIAMAISREPRVLIADEPTTALDVTVQSQILRLIDWLRRDLGMALVLISHDLGVVAGVTDRVAIMYAGRIVETAATATVFDQPRHPYTRALLDAIPRLDVPVAERLRPIPGIPPDPRRPLPGCPFHPRCGAAEPRCAEDLPQLEGYGVGGDHRVACWVAAAGTTAAGAGAGVEPGRQAEAPPEKADGIVVRDLSVHFPVRSGILRRVAGTLRAVDGVSFEIGLGKTVGLVGESGSGKTTTGRALLGLSPMTTGQVTSFGRRLDDLRRERRALARLGQMVFQDPYASLNPRMTVGAALHEVLTAHGLAASEGRSARVRELVESVGLRPDVAARYPHELSGGQRQRIAIARALAIEPRFIVFDEVVSSLDVSIQGQILNLLRDLQRQKGLTYLFITHNLGVARHVSHGVVVMYGGKIMERAPSERLFAAPHHPYTYALLSAVPVPDPRVERARPRIDVRSDPPDPVAPPPGCRFHRSCLFATEACRAEEPRLRPVADGHDVACHHWDKAEVRGALAAAVPGVA